MKKKEFEVEKKVRRERKSRSDSEDSWQEEEKR